MYLDWLVPVVIRLEQFFQHFENSPHQRAAIQRLQEDIDPALLQRNAKWFEIWKAGGKMLVFKVPYFRQSDLKNGHRKCFTSAIAMLAANYGLIDSQQEYDEIRAKYGDTVHVNSHLKALTELGIRSEFVSNGTVDLIEAEIDAERPVAVGWLHRGDISTGRPAEGMGHWSIIIGYTEKFFIVHDPRGEHDIKTGRLLNPDQGEAVFYERESFLHRWQVEGPGSGWAILVEDLPPLLM